MRSSEWKLSLSERRRINSAFASPIFCAATSSSNIDLPMTRQTSIEFLNAIATTKNFSDD